MSGEEPEPEPEPSILPTLAASTSANALARLPCHPIDTIKAKLQVQGKAAAGASGVGAQAGGPIAAARGVLRTEGVAGLYRGIGITILGVTPSPPPLWRPHPAPLDGCG